MTSSYFLTLLLISISHFSAAETHTPNYYQDIRPIIEENCLGCHSSKGISFSFEDPEQAYLFHTAINSAVQERRMPPWLAETGHQIYKDDISLSQLQIKQFEQWAEAGYPKGNKSAETSVISLALPPITTPFKADLSLESAQQAYLPKQEQKDDYRCFIVDWPESKDKFVTGFKAIPGNTKIVHHIVLFAARPEVTDMFKELEAEEEGIGYQCFGGAVPDRLGDDNTRRSFEKKYPEGVKKLSQNNYWLAHWAPGMDGYHFPENTGVPVKKGSALILQVHYYSAFAPGKKDPGSQLSFTLADSVEKPAIHFPLTRNDWLYSKKNQSMVIKPGQQKTYSVNVPLKNIANYTAWITETKMENVNAVEIHSANVHMHSFGASGRTAVVYNNGDKETLLSIPRWDIDWQRDFTLAEPKHFDKNQFKQIQLSVDCRFKNHSDEIVYGGYGSDDEMCFNFSYIALELTAKDVVKQLNTTAK